MFRLTIEKALNHIINVNNIDIAPIDNKVISLGVDDIDLSLFFLCLNSRIFVIDNGQNKKTDVEIRMNKASFLSLFKGIPLEDLIEKEDIEINGSIKTAQNLADLLASSSIDIEELVSQYTGDIVAHQVGRSLNQIKNISLSNDGSIIDNLKEELTTILIAPSRAKIFKGRAS
ncbi:MAG: SCP2 sterol-binding domain-containing protein [Candidatus Thioglobus sp.]|jgi:ubiquinone biosynthesis protein UbiJ|nr:SCP2 sterol-binding domain-containing protein [Candidatus Thioglobus sp.]